MRPAITTYMTRGSELRDRTGDQDVRAAMSRQLDCRVVVDSAGINQRMISD